MACFRYIIILVLAPVLLFLQTSYALTDGLTIEISQAKRAETGKRITISCTSRTDHRIREIMRLGVLKNNNKKIIQYLVGGSTLTSEDLPDRFQVKGFMSDDRSQASLNLTISNPIDEDVGMYTCTLIYKNNLGTIDVEDKSRSIKLGDLQIKVEIDDLLNQLEKLEKKNEEQALQLETIKREESEHETIVNDLLNQVSVLKTNQTFLKNQMKAKVALAKETNQQIRERLTILEAENRNLSTQLVRMESEESGQDGAVKNLVSRLSTLERQDKDQSMQIQSVKNRVTLAKKTGEGFMARVDDLEKVHVNISDTVNKVVKSKENVAFSAMFAGRGMTLNKGATVSFPDLQSQFGRGYNNGTGVFTAPKAGMYNFLTRVRIQCQATGSVIYDVRLDVVTTGHIVDVFDGIATQTTLTVLEVGDEVKVAVNDDVMTTMSQCQGAGKFSGYLVSP